MLYENYLLLVNRREFTQKILNNLLKRLLLFLHSDIKAYPKLKKITKFNETGRAAYDHNTNSIEFSMDAYKIKKPSSKIKPLLTELTSNSIVLAQYKFRYFIPLSDIYHELIHCVQYQCGNYRYNDLIEAVDDCFTYILTGQENIDYYNESFKFWYICKYTLDITDAKFFTLLRDAIITNNFEQIYFLNNKKFIKFISKVYNHDIKKFFNTFKTFEPSISKADYEIAEKQFKKTLTSLHNTLFYKY